MTKTHEVNKQKEKVNENVSERKTPNTNMKGIIDINLSKASKKNKFSEIAAKYIRGKGIHIGQVNRQLDIPNNTLITYVDASYILCSYNEISTEEEGYDHSDFKYLKMCPLDKEQGYDGSKKEQLDFCIVTDIIEQAIYPEKIMSDCLSILKPGGILYLIVSEGIYTKTDEKLDSKSDIKIEILDNHEANYKNKKYAVETILNNLSLKDPGLFNVIDYLYGEIDEKKLHAFIIEKNDFVKEIFECLLEKETKKSTDTELDVIIPVYNAYEDLIRCLQSVLIYQELLA
jgi:SAM-dependent methyltransferase